MADDRKKISHRLRPILLSGLILLAGVAQGCTPQTPSWRTLKSQIREEFPDVEHISVAEFEYGLEDTTPAKTLIVDVREPEEFAVSHLHNAVNLDDPDAILALAHQQNAEQIILYCSVGYRSAQMAQTLEQQGWDAVVNLEGSIFAWANSGRHVFLEDEQVEVVHPFDPVWGQLLDPQYHPD